MSLLAPHPHIYTHTQTFVNCVWHLTNSNEREVALTLSAVYQENTERKIRQATRMLCWGSCMHVGLEMLRERKMTSFCSCLFWLKPPAGCASFLLAPLYNLTCKQNWDWDFSGCSRSVSDKVMSFCHAQKTKRHPAWVIRAFSRYIQPVVLDDSHVIQTRMGFCHFHRFPMSIFIHHINYNEIS